MKISSSLKRACASLLFVFTTASAFAGTASDTSADYIVISPPSFVSYWEDFIAYRKSTHPSMTFALVSTTDIYAEYAGSDDALKIHHFLEAMYAKGTRYVLLGAGCQKASYDKNSMIPTRQVIIQGDFQTCDYYYCAMTKPSAAKEVWDYNGDGIYLGSKNTSGGYYSDAAAQYSMHGDMMVHRFPARTSVTVGGVTRTAEQQIKGYVAKLRRAEEGLFPGRFSQILGGDVQSADNNFYRGNTDADMTMEREFYDLGDNIFSKTHSSQTTSIERYVRERGYNYMTLKRPVGLTGGVAFKDTTTYPSGWVYTHDAESVTINAHGNSTEPMDKAGVWKATGLWRFYILCIPCHAGNIIRPENNTDVMISEAAVLNPNGGALICYANSHYGIYGGQDNYSSRIERDVIRALYGYNGSFQNAGQARLTAQNSYGGTGRVMANSIALGDPLVGLSPIYSRKINSAGEWMRADQTVVSDQEYASTLTVNAEDADLTVNLTNDVGAATLNVNGLNGKTLTIAGNKTFKVTNAINVDNGNLTLDMPGGFGRNGITFNNGAGKLKIQGEHKGYYGIRFNNIAELEVAGGGATLDFDFISGTFRNGSGKIESMKFTGSGENTIRSRQAGIFSADFTIPVTGGGTLVLETPNVGGSTAQNAATPLFAVTNATLAVSSNPNWTSESFSRSVWLENGNIESRSDSFYLGPYVNAYPGYDLWVGGQSGLNGANAIRLNGELRLHSFTGGVVTVATEIMDGGKAGSIKPDAGVTLKMTASSSFTGGLTIPSGARVVVDNAGGLGMGSVTVQSGGILQINQMPLTGVKRVTLESGSKLVLTSSDGASYQMYTPASTTFTIAEGVNVYDSKNEGKILNGVVTPEGAYLVTEEAKYWGGTGVPWQAVSNQQIWKKGTAWTTYNEGDTVLFKNLNIAAATVNTSGSLNPGMMVFQNTATAYTFEGDSTTITVPSLATVNETTFKPSIKAETQVSVGGKTTFSTITTPLLNVASGALKVDGAVEGIETFKVVKLIVDGTQGVPNYADGAVHPLEFSEIQLLDANGSIIYFPVDTTIADSVGNTTKVTALNGSTYTFNSESTLNNLFDGSCTTYHAFGNNKNGTLTITLPKSMPMFKYFRYGRGQSYSTGQWGQMYSGYSTYPDSNPSSWRLASGGSEATLTTVINQSKVWDANSSSLTGNYTASSAGNTSKATVNEGAKLYLSGTYKVPLTVQSGAIFAVTNNSVLTISAGRTLPGGAGSILIDTSEAAKSTSYMKVTQGLNLATDQVVRFAALDDSIAFKIGDDHELYVATDGVMKAPYYATIDADTNWGSAAWKDGDTNDFANAWSSSTQQPLADINITVTGSGKTLNNDCAVTGTTLTLGSAADVGTFTVSGSGSLKVTSIDASGLQGNLVWGQSLNGANFTAPVGTTTITSETNGGKLIVPEGATVILQGSGLFAEYENNGYIRYEGTYGSKDSGSFAHGDVSIKSATLTGGLQVIDRTYHVLSGDALNFNGNLNSRINSSFNVEGGSITLTSGGATSWFGYEERTHYRQTGGTFTCTANGTAFNGSANGLLLAYSSDGGEPMGMEIYGGVFEVPNSSLNFWRPTMITIETNGLVRTKGVYTGNSQPGTITVGQGGTFELGSLGVDLHSCTFNLFGGTLAGYENGAKLQSSINFSGSGTIAAKEGTTFKVLSSVNGSGILTIGATNYTGTVQFSALPAEVDEFVVAGGTLHLGALRPLEKTLGLSAGAVAITLTNTQITDAQTTPVQIMQAAAVPAGGVKVYSSHGVLQSETIAAIDDDGYLTVQTTHDNTVQMLSNATWNNTGDATTAGVLTGNNFGVCNYTTMTFNFGTVDNIACKNIGNEGKVIFKTIKFLKRETNGTATPASVTLTQGEKSISGTVTYNSSEQMVVYLNTWPATSGAFYTKKTGGVYTLTFESEETFDTSENITLTFPTATGLIVMQPQNSLLQYNSWSPVVQIIGDYSWDSGEVEGDGGDSISVNVIGGNKQSRTGKSITLGKAGVYPIAAANWNQKESRTDNDAFENTYSSLTEVLSDGTTTTSPASVTLKGACTYTAGIATTNANAELEYGYIDDGGTGAKIALSGIPYSQYDVYVYMGSDQTTSENSFAPVTVTSGNFTTNYPAASTAWGNATATHGEVTLEDGVNYFKVSGLTGSELVVQGSVNGTVSGARCGLAGIQVVNTGIRYENYTWNGGTEGGVWSTTAANWLSPDGAEVAWPTTGEGNVAVFNTAAKVEVQGEVRPAQIQIGAGLIASTADYIKDSEQVVFANTQLKYITGISGKLSGAYMAEGDATPYFFTNDGSTATVQLQKVDDTFVKCVKVTLRQVGDNIVASHTYAKYVSGSTLGQNFDSTGTAQTEVKSDTGLHVYSARGLKANYATLDLSGEGAIASPVTVKGGLLSVTPELLASDITLAADAGLNIVADEEADEIVVAGGTISGLTDLRLNGHTISASKWELQGSTLVKIEQKSYRPSAKKLLVNLYETESSAEGWVNNKTTASANDWTMAVAVGGGAMWNCTSTGTDFSADAKAAILVDLKANLGLAAKLSDAAYDSIVRSGTGNGQASKTGTITLSGLDNTKYYNLYWAGGNVVSGKSTTPTLAFTTVSTDDTSTLQYITSGGATANSWQIMTAADTVSAGAADTILLVKALKVKPVNGSIVLNVGASYNPMNFVALVELEEGVPVDPSTAEKLAINFFTPENNKIGVEYILGETVWTNIADAVSGENYWRNANATALNGSDGAATLVYKTPESAAQTLLAGGKGLNPNANLKTSDQYWQVAIPLNLPEGISYTFKEVLPEILTLTSGNGQQSSGNQLTFSASVTLVSGTTTNTTGRIGPSSVLNGTAVNTVKGNLPSALTMSGDNTLILKMWHDDNDSTQAQVYTAALGMELYLSEEEEEPEVSWLITERSDTAFDVSTGREGTSEKTLVFALPEGAVQEITGSSTDANRGYGLKVTSGILNFTQTGGTTSFAGRLVTAEGSNAVVRLAYGDATGYTTGGTGIALKDGGLLKIAARDTLKTPITLENGRILLESGVANNSGRALDLFAGSAGNNWTVSGNSSLTSEGSGDDRKVLIRDGAWNIDVAASGKMVLDVDVITSGIDASGTSGALVKKGAGELELKSLPIGAALTIETGTINLVATITDGFTICSGDLLGASEENIYVNGVKLAESDWKLSGNQLVKRGPTIVEGTGEATDLGGGSYAVPPTVDKMTGLAPEKVVVKAEGYNITAVFSITGDATTGVTITLSTDKTKSVTIDEETITLEPVIDAEHEKTEIAAGGLAVKTIPGLNYKLIRGETLGEWGESPVASERATGQRTALKDPKPPAAKAFYKVVVEK